MPQIPVFNPSQRIDPGSPVAAISPEKADMTQEMTSRLGQALVQLGDYLDDAAKKAKSKDDQISIEIAQNEYERKLQYLEVQQKAQPVDPTDPTGVKTVKERFNTVSDQLRDELMSTLSPEAQKVFKAKAGNTANTYSARALADEIDRREKLVPIKMQQLIGSYGATAYDNPLKADEMVSKALVVVEESDLTPEVKQLKQLEIQKDIYEKALYGRLSLARSSPTSAKSSENFAAAQGILESRLNKLLTPDELDKLSNKIRKEQQDAINLETSEMVLKDKLNEKDIEAKVKAAYALDLNRLSKAGNNDFERNKILRDSKANPIYMNDPQKLRELENTIIFKDYADDTYQNKLVYNLLTNKISRSDALKQLEKDVGVRVSVDRANRLQKEVDDVSKTKESYANIANVISAGKRAVEQKYGIRGYDPATGDAIMIDQAGYNAVLDYNIAIARQGKSITPEKVKEIASRFNSRVNITIPSGTNVNQSTSIEGIRNTLKEIAVQVKQGRMTKKRANELMAPLLDNLRVLELEQNSKIPEAKKEPPKGPVRD